MPLPVLRRALGMQDQRVGRGSLQDGILASGQVIDGPPVREREAVRAVLVLLVLLPRRTDDPGKSMVHPHQAPARDVRHHAVEHAPAPHVGVVSPVDEVPDATPGLRTPPRIRLVDGPREGVRDAAPVGLVVSKEAHEIAHHGVAESVGPGVARGVDELVDPAGLEAAEDVDVGIRFDERGFGPLRIEPDAALDAREGPPIACDRLAGVVGIAPPRQSRSCGVERDGGVASRGHPPAQRIRRDSGPIGDELGPHETGEGLGAVARHRHVEEHAPAARQQVPLPCRPHDRVPAAHEKSVAGVAQGSRIVRCRRIVEELELSLVPAVAVSEEEPAVARTLRLEHADIGRVLHEAAGIARHLVEIDDVRVGACIGVDGEVRPPDESFVGTGALEGMALREWLALRDPQLQCDVHDTSRRLGTSRQGSIIETLRGDAQATSRTAPGCSSSRRGGRFGRRRRA